MAKGVERFGLEGDFSQGEPGWGLRSALLSQDTGQMWNPRTCSSQGIKAGRWIRDAQASAPGFLTLPHHTAPLVFLPLSLFLIPF